MKLLIENWRQYLREVIGLDDLLRGEGGDYLVQYGPGDYGVVGREIFGRTYK